MPHAHVIRWFAYINGDFLQLCQIAKKVNKNTPKQHPDGPSGTFRCLNCRHLQSVRPMNSHDQINGTTPLISSPYRETPPSLRGSSLWAGLKVSPDLNFEVQFRQWQLICSCQPGMKQPILMVIFHSYVSLPEGITIVVDQYESHS